MRCQSIGGRQQVATLKNTRKSMMISGSQSIGVNNKWRHFLLSTSLNLETRKMRDAREQQVPVVLCRDLQKAISAPPGWVRNQNGSILVESTLADCHSQEPHPEKPARRAACPTPCRRQAAPPQPQQ